MPSYRYLLIVLTLCIPANGQRIRVGVVGGGDFSRDFSEQFVPASPTRAGYEQTSNTVGYTIGPSIRIQLRRRLDFELNALFKPLRFTQATILPDGSRRSVSPATVVTWQFPLLMKYQLLDTRVSPFIVGGPSLRTAGNLNATRPSSAGITAGAGLTIPWGPLHFEPSLRYTRWKADRPGPGVRTQPDQVEFLLGVVTAGTDSNWKPLHERVGLGVLAGATLTDRLRYTGAEKRFLAGPQVGVSLAGPISLQFNAIYSPFGTNVTWEFPLLLRYAARTSLGVRPIIEAGPSFRTPQELNGSRLARYGVAAGGGVEMPAGRVRASAVLRFTHWAQESNPARSLLYRNQIQLLFGVAF